MFVNLCIHMLNQKLGGAKYRTIDDGVVSHTFSCALVLFFTPFVFALIILTTYVHSSISISVQGSLKLWKVIASIQSLCYLYSHISIINFQKRRSGKFCQKITESYIGNFFNLSKANLKNQLHKSIKSNLDFYLKYRSYF